MVRGTKIEKGIKNWQVIKNWAKIVGQRIAQHTRPIGLNADNLFIEVDNPLWKSQLFLMKDMLINKLKKYNVTFKDIKFSIVSNEEKYEKEKRK